MKQFNSNKLKRILNLYKSIDLSYREECFNADETDKFYADAIYRARMQKMQLIVLRMHRFFWRKTDIDLRLSNTLFIALLNADNYDIEPILRNINDFYEHVENEFLEAKKFFENIKENQDIIDEAMAGDNTAKAMLIQEFQTQNKKRK